MEQRKIVIFYLLDIGWLYAMFDNLWTNQKPLNGLRTLPFLNHSVGIIQHSLVFSNRSNVCQTQYNLLCFCCFYSNKWKLHKNESEQLMINVVISDSTWNNHTTCFKNASKTLAWLNFNQKIQKDLTQAFDHKAQICNSLCKL